MVGPDPSASPHDHPRCGRGLIRRSQSDTRCACDARDSWGSRVVSAHGESFERAPAPYPGDIISFEFCASELIAGSSRGGQGKTSTLIPGRGEGPAQGEGFGVRLLKDHVHPAPRSRGGAADSITPSHSRWWSRTAHSRWSGVRPRGSWGVAGGGNGDGDRCATCRPWGT